MTDLGETELQEKSGSLAAKRPCRAYVCRRCLLWWPNRGATEILHVDKIDVRTYIHLHIQGSSRNGTVAMTKVRSDCRQQFVHAETEDIIMRAPFIRILTCHCSLVLG